MGQLRENFSSSAGSTLDSAAVNGQLTKHLANVKSPEGFTNRPEFERRYLEMARENLAETYLLEKVQNGKPFGTQEAIAHVKALPKDYQDIKLKTGEMENIVNPTSNTGTTRMSGPTKDKLHELEGTSASLKEAARDDVTFKNDKNTQDFISSANKKGLRAQDVVTFYELSQGETLPSGLSTPLLEAQRSIDDQKAQQNAPSATASVKAAAPAP